MRNWNTCDSGGYIYVGAYGFQTTYEELKLGIPVAVVTASVYRFQTTYEELKPLKTGLNLMPKECFQTTYEELKLGIPVAVVTASVYASRLPMRNWNQGKH